MSDKIRLKLPLPVVQDALKWRPAARPLAAMHHGTRQLELANLQPAPTGAHPATVQRPAQLAANLFRFQRLPREASAMST